MCGFFGSIGLFDQNAASVIRHRGPDGFGFFQSQYMSLGHVRLSIIDPTNNSKQPFYVSCNGKHYHVVFNGECYNYESIREELINQFPGLVFKTRGDTEVVAFALGYWGLSALGKFNGIFSLAWWNVEDCELYMARDQFGTKPLYWMNVYGKGLLFASEAKLLIPYVDRTISKINEKVLIQHLSFCHRSESHTSVVGIQCLPPGEWLRWNAREGSVESGIWKALKFDISRFYNSKNKMVEFARELSRTVRKAVERQLVADVPVGSFLSGGLDSSLITAFAAGIRPEQFHCFTITYPDGDDHLDRGGDDPSYARKLVSKLGVELHEIAVRPDVATLLPMLIWHLDEPLVDPAAISCYLMSREARARGIPVILSGQGADEIFAGYPRYRVMAARERYSFIPKPLRRLIGGCAQFIPSGHSGRLGVLARRLKKASVGFGLDADDHFLSLCAPTPVSAVLRVLSPEMRSLVGDPFAPCRERMNRIGLSGINRYLERDQMVYLPNHNLLYTDKMGMAASIEIRVPFLDNDVVALANSLPTDWKLRPTLKAILREAAVGIIEDDIIYRPKAGLGAPYRTWLKRDLHVMWNDLLTESSVRQRGWFDFKELQRIRSRSLSGIEDLYMLQWGVLTAELWAREFLDSNPAKSPWIKSHC